MLQHDRSTAEHNSKPPLLPPTTNTTTTATRIFFKKSHTQICLFICVSMSIDCIWFEMIFHAWLELLIAFHQARLYAFHSIFFLPFHGLLALLLFAICVYLRAEKHSGYSICCRSLHVEAYPFTFTSPPLPLPVDRWIELCNLRWIRACLNASPYSRIRNNMCTIKNSSE